MAISQCLKKTNWSDISAKSFRKICVLFRFPAILLRKQLYIVSLTDKVFNA